MTNRAPDDKEKYVHQVFDTIAPGYDRMNMLMTFGMWKYWQTVFRRLMAVEPGQEILDVGCGTADLSIIAARALAGEAGHVTGIDLSQEMLDVGRIKLHRLGLADRITLLQGNALALPFADQRFHLVISGFMLRNVSDVQRALQEMTRVVRPGGRVVVMELTHPENRIIAAPYLLYFRHVVPWLGRWANGEGKLPPYAWLPESLREIPPAPVLMRMMERAGLTDVSYRSLTGGIVAIHQGRKTSDG